MPRWWWACDATPGSRASALEADDGDVAQALTLPAEDEPLGFEQHIKPLFRQRDRQSMKFAFDLWSYDDVCRHADAIVERLCAGSMPCDGVWPPEWIAVMQRWIDSGKPA